MNPVYKPPIRLNDLARLAEQLNADSDMPLHKLAARDRKIGMQYKTGSDQSKLMAWLDALGSRTDLHLDSLVTTISAWLGIAGFISGICVMTGLLVMGRQQPVNVLLFLTLFIGTQLLFLLLTLVVSLSMARAGALHLPFESLNPARFMLRRVLAKLTKHIGEASFATVGRLALLRWGQLFGVAFNIGAAVAFMLILLVTDRSFGWSSTLEISDQVLLRITQVLSAPWSQWLPATEISPDIIAITRFRALQVVFDAQQVAAMRAWWPFLFLNMIVYGLLPRAILWTFFQLQYRRRLDAAFLHYPGAGLVLERMASPRVDTRSDTDMQEAGLAPGQDVGTLVYGRHFTVLIDWAAAVADSSEGLQALGVNAGMIEQAGLQSADDLELISDLNRDKPGNTRLSR